MTNKTPLHGGSIRVAFDGGTGIRKSIPFRAVAVNIDNWSPYWYKLNPIEEYIPPFQNGVNIRLPLITDFEFVCLAPPGIEQATIVSTTGIAGNTFPVIALFSSFDTNNDAGNSALVQAANVTFPLVDINTGPGSIVVATIDMTLYNGIYFYVVSSSITAVTLSFFFISATGNTSFESYVLYRNEKMLFTIPKLGQTLQINATSLGNINLDATYRAFQGYADFAATPIGFNGANPPSLGDNQSITGNGSITFGVSGIDNAVVTVSVRNSGVSSADRFWVRISIPNYGSSFANTLIYSKAFIAGIPNNALHIPLNNILQRQAQSVVVNVVTTNAAAVTDIALHHVHEPATNTDYFTPSPYNISGTAVVPTGTNLFFTFLAGGYLTAVEIALLTASVTAGAEVGVWAGTAVAPIIPLGVVPATAITRYVLNSFRPVAMDTSFSSVWTVNNSAAGVYIALSMFMD